MSVKLLGNQTACEELARKLAVQPEFAAFFSDLNVIAPESAPRRTAKAYAYTGNKSQVDETTKIKIGAMRLLGASDRQIEAELHVDHRSIPIHIADLEQTGQLPALKERLTRLVGDNAERSSLLLRVLLEKGLSGEVSIELAAMLKAAGSVNCFQVEKFQLLTGGATEIIEQRIGAGREEIERWWREQAVPVPATVLPIESGSPATPANPQQIPTNSTDGHGADTSDRPDARTASPDGPKPGQGGGGSAAGGVPEKGDGSTAF